VAANKLGRRIDDNVGSPLDDEPAPGWRKCCRSRTALYDRGRCGPGSRFPPRRVSDCQRLGVERLGFGIDRSLQAVEIVAIDEAHLDAQLGQRVVEEIVSAAVERRGGYDLVTGRGEGNRSQGLGRLSGSGGQSGDATLEGRDPFFETSVVGFMIRV